MYFTRNICKRLKLNDALNDIAKAEGWHDVEEHPDWDWDAEDVLYNCCCDWEHDVTWDMDTEFEVNIERMRKLHPYVYKMCPAEAEFWSRRWKETADLKKINWICNHIFRDPIKIIGKLSGGK